MVPQDSYTWNEVMEELSDLYKLLSVGEVLSAHANNAQIVVEKELPNSIRT